jgi:hypothetical protein
LPSPNDVRIDDSFSWNRSPGAHLPIPRAHGGGYKIASTDFGKIDYPVVADARHPRGRYGDQDQGTPLTHAVQISRRGNRGGDHHIRGNFAYKNRQTGSRLVPNSACSYFDEARARFLQIAEDFTWNTRTGTTGHKNTRSLQGWDQSRKKPLHGKSNTICLTPRVHVEGYIKWLTGDKKDEKSSM